MSALVAVRVFVVATDRVSALAEGEMSVLLAGWVCVSADNVEVRQRLGCVSPRVGPAHVICHRIIRCFSFYCQ